MKSPDNIHFDVIIPTHNSHDYIGRALDSVISQTYPSWTVYVVDGSDDDLTSHIVMDFMQRYPLHDIRFVDQDRDHHPHLSGARNQAIALGSSTHIALLDSDDIWYPEHLEELVGGWHESPDAAMVCTVGEYDQDYHSVKGNTSFRRRFHLDVLDERIPRGAEWLLATHYPGLIIVPSVSSFKRALFESVGGFPRVRYEEDVALFSLLLREGGVSTGEGGESFKQVPFVGAWLDWLRGGHKVSDEMHGAGKSNLQRDRSFYSMRWHDWCQHLLSDPPAGLIGTGWEDRCRTIIRGDWPW